MATDVFCIAVAVVLVAMKLSLEHVRDKDKKEGKIIDPKNYTIRGVIKQILADSKTARANQRLQKKNSCTRN